VSITLCSTHSLLNAEITLSYQLTFIPRKPNFWPRPWSVDKLFITRSMSLDTSSIGKTSRPNSCLTILALVSVFWMWTRCHCWWRCSVFDIGSRILRRRDFLGVLQRSTGRCHGVGQVRHCYIGSVTVLNAVLYIVTPTPAFSTCWL